MLSMSDGELTNILLAIIGGLLMFVAKGVRDWCKKTDYTLQDHEHRIISLEHSCPEVKR